MSQTPACAPPQSPGVPRRWLTLGTIAVLLLLGISPIVAHHVTTAMDRSAIYAEHIAGFCAVALREMLSPVHHMFHIVLLGGLIYATCDRMRMWFRSRTLMKRVPSREPAKGDRVHTACLDANVSPSVVRIVSDLSNPAFTIGLWRPLIYFSRKALSRLSHAELVAVIKHENAHVVRRDPLRLAGLRFAANLFFWLPALRDLAANSADDGEFLADDQAAISDPLVLASAIIKLARFRGTEIPGVAAFAAQSGLVEHRVRRLMGQNSSPPTHVRARSLSFGILMLAAVWVSAIFAEPTHAMTSHGSHCAHHGGLPFGHIFCDWEAVTTKADCPHDLLEKTELVRV